MSEITLRLAHNAHVSVTKGKTPVLKEIASATHLEDDQKDILFGPTDAH